MKKNIFLKGAGVLLVVTVLILSTVAVTANTDELIPTMTKSGMSYGPMMSSVEDPLPTSLDTFTEDFEGGIVPTKWLNIDYDADYYFWEIKSAGGGWTPHSGQYSIASASYVNDPGMPLFPDNWLVTVPLTISATSQLSYWVAAQDPDWAQEHLEVWISTTGNTVPDDFTDEIESYTLPPGSDEWNEHVLDLSTYDGETIYIAFRHCDVSDMFWIKIDDVVVTDVTFPEEGAANLECEGSLSWDDVEPSATVTGDFEISNTGEQYSWLNWEITEVPEWGDWTFEPASGVDLSDGYSLTVDVDVIAPEDENEEFTGEIKIENSDDPGNFCIIPVELVTPCDAPVNSLLELLMQRFPFFAYLVELIF
jgi:hypothetical protein